MAQDLLNQFISESYEVLLQISGSQVADGTGSLVTFLDITASYAQNAGEWDGQYSGSNVNITAPLSTIDGQVRVNSNSGNLPAFRVDAGISGSTGVRSVVRGNQLTNFPTAFQGIHIQGNQAVTMAIQFDATDTGSVKPTLFMNSNGNGSRIISEDAFDIAILNNDPLTINAPVILAQNATGSLFGTASFADNATSASHALNADNSISSSHSVTATSSSFATTSISSSFSLTADTSISSSHAIQADSALTATSSSLAVSSSFATVAQALTAGNKTINGNLSVQGSGNFNPNNGGGGTAFNATSNGSGSISVNLLNPGFGSQPVLFFDGDFCFFQATGNFFVENAPGGQGTGSMNFVTNGDLNFNVPAFNSNVNGGNINFLANSGSINLQTGGDINIEGKAFHYSTSTNINGFSIQVNELAVVRPNQRAYVETPLIIGPNGTVIVEGGSTLKVISEFS